MCALTMVLAGVSLVEGPPASPSRVPVGGAAALGLGSNLSVAIDPASWWMESGTNATLAASWVGTPAGCSLEPTWFRWAIAPGGSDGALGATNGSRTEFFASDAGTGTTTVVVRAAASLDCHGNISASFSRATAVVTVAVPLAVDGLAFRADPIAPGAAAELVGALVGGNAPYRLRVAWADGGLSYANVSGPGSFSIIHEYSGTGTFEPVVLATDAAGRTDASDPEEPLYVSGAFAAAIVPSTLVAEEGVPALFGINTTDAPSSFSWLFACENASPASTGRSTGLVYGCAFDAAGIAPVSFEAVGASAPFPIATATLEEAVVPPPSIGLPSTLPGGEVGETVYAPVELSGGVPPFTLDWSLVGTGSAGTETVPSDGTAYLPLCSDLAGALVLSVAVVDALGEADAPAEERIAFAPSLDVWAAAAAGVAAGAVALNVSASALEGAPPFDWAVVPGLSAVNGSAEAGTLSASGSFAWNATYRTEGTLGVTVTVVDAAGVSAVVNLTVLLAPRLSISAQVDPDGPGLVTLVLNVSGGVAPFAYRWNDSSGDVWNGSAAGAGTLVLREAPDTSGSCSFSVVLVDALGMSASSQVRANVPARGAGPDPGSGAMTALVVAGLLGMVASAVLLLRRRRPSPTPAPPDPVAVLREAIEPSDGVDRGLVELLAEERGVPLEVVRATLERLKADGTVRAGRGSDGEEVLAWAEPPAR
jgi:hypothetical protein